MAKYKIFSETEFITEMQQLLLQNGLHEKKLNFLYYESSYVTYEKIIDNRYYTIKIRCDDTLYKKVVAHDLLELSDITYLEFSIYNYPSKNFIEGYIYDYDYNDEKNYN